MVTSLILLNLVGGDCVEDLEHLEQDGAFLPGSLPLFTGRAQFLPQLRQLFTHDVHQCRGRRFEIVRGGISSGWVVMCRSG